MERNKILRLIFNRCVEEERMRGRSGACQFLMGGVRYMVNQSCVYSERSSPDGSGEEERQVLPVGQEPLRAPARLESVLPERMLAQGSVSLAPCDAVLQELGTPVLVPVPVAVPGIVESGVMVCNRLEDPGDCILEALLSAAGSDLDISAIRCREYVLSPGMLDIMRKTGETFESLGARLVQSHKRDTLVVTFSTGTALLCVCASAVMDQVDLTVKVGDNTLLGDAWSDTDHCYKHLIRRRKQMLNGLKNPYSKPQVVEVSPAEPVVEEAISADVAVECEQTSKPPCPVAVPAALQPTPQSQPTSQPTPQTVEVSPADPVVEGTQAEPKSRHRRQARQAGAVSPAELTRLTDALGGTLNLTVEQLDDALEECRRLRDLVIAAQRRQTNIVTMISKLTKEATDNYVAIKCLVIGK